MYINMDFMSEQNRLNDLRRVQANRPDSTVRQGQSLSVVSVLLVSPLRTRSLISRTSTVQKTPLHTAPRSGIWRLPEIGVTQIIDFKRTSQYEPSLLGYLAF